MVNEVLETGLGDLKCVLGVLESLGLRDGVWDTFVFTCHISFDILLCLLGVTGNIEGVSGCFGDGKTVVESNACWDGTKP